MLPTIGKVSDAIFCSWAGWIGWNADCLICRCYVNIFCHWRTGKSKKKNSVFPLLFLPSIIFGQVVTSCRRCTKGVSLADECGQTEGEVLHLGEFYCEPSWFKSESWEAQMSISVKDHWQGNRYFRVQLESDVLRRCRCFFSSCIWRLQLSWCISVVRMRSILVIRISISIFSLPSCPAIFHSLGVFRSHKNSKLSITSKH